MSVTETSQSRLAVLIDADNAQPSITGGLLSEVAKYGVASVKRIYGDWTTPNLNGWKSILLEHSIQPFQQFRYTVGKNATDSAPPQRALRPGDPQEEPETPGRSDPAGHIRSQGLP